MNDKDESIIYHIQALRTTLINSLISVAIFLIPAFFIAPKCLNVFVKYIIKDNNIKLNFFTPIEVFVLQIKIALLIAFIIAFPYIAFQFWKFFKPALYENEKKFIKSTVFLSSFLFIAGALFCIFIILPFIISFGISFNSSNIQAVFNITNIINLGLWMSAAFGLMFQFPLIVYALIKSDIISYATIASKRPYVVVILLILAAILTPPDVVSQLLLFFPTYMLFELGLLFSKKYNTKSLTNSSSKEVE